MANNLQALFRNKNVFSILSLFFSEPSQKFYLREIARRLGLSSGSIHGDLKILESSGLVSGLSRGRNKYFSLNQDSPYFPALSGLFKGKLPIKSTQEIMTVLFEEHWVSPLTQMANYFGWHAFITDPGWSSRPGSYAGVYRGNFLQFPFHELSWTARSQEVMERLESPAFANKNYRDFLKVAEKMQALISEMLGIGRVNDNFVEQLAQLYLLGIEACRIGYVGVSADLPSEKLSRRMREILEGRTQGLNLKQSVPELVNLLSSPPYLSLAFIREQVFLRLALSLGKRKSAHIKENKKILAQVEEYRRLYSWTDFGHFGNLPDKDEILSELSVLAEKETAGSFRRRLKEIEGYAAKTKALKEDWYKRLKLSRSERTIFEAAGLFSLVKALRLEHLSGLNSQLKVLAEHLAKQHKIDSQYLYFCTFGEIQEIYRSGLSQAVAKILKDRFKFCILTVGGDYFGGRIVSGQAAQKFYRCYVREVKREISDIESFHGSVAYPGNVRGRVKVINSPKEMGKMEDGDILVTTQTIPEMLPAMRQAIAFVTNTGGITCHAAIVAREMRKPCIVGTKMATQVLHDGDFIQVDAYKGVVKIVRLN